MEEKSGLWGEVELRRTYRTASRQKGGGLGARRRSCPEQGFFSLSLSLSLSRTVPYIGTFHFGRGNPPFFTGPIISSEDGNLSFVTMRPGLQDNEHKDLLTPQREDENSESDIDDEYKTFLDHLREDGYSYVFETSPLHIKYEEEDEPFNDNATETQGNSETDPRQRSYVASKEKLANSQSGRVIFPSNAVKHLKLGKTAIDPCYQEFLHHVRVRGDSVFLKLDNGVTIKYGEEVESPNAPIATEATPFPGEEPELCDGSLMPPDTFIPMFEDDATFTGTSSNKISYFEKGLMSLCDKPFDQDEYEDLLHKVSTCGPKTRDRHLRGNTKTYQTKEMAESYLDLYPDFAEHIKTPCCRKHCLKQLRGFIFWLQNLCHEGTFQPWRDEQFNLCDNC